MTAFERVVDSLRRIFNTAWPETRAMELSAVGEQLWLIGIERNEPTEDGYGGEGYYLSRLMVEEDGLYAIYNRLGRLYRTKVGISNGEVTIGELVEVLETFTPVSRTFIQREANGDVRLYMIAGVSAVNRDGEIDSRQLFDNFVRYAESTGVYPKIDWYHLGGQLEICDMGQCDFVARGTNTYIASGVLDMANPVARQVVARMDEGEVFGCSIEYYPVLREDGTESVETIYIGDIPIRVYQDGFNSRITLLPEQKASHVMTMSMRSERTNRVNAQQALRLRALFDGDEEQFLEFVEKAGLTERSLDGAVTREAGEAADSPAPVAEDVQETEAPVEAESDEDEAGTEAADDDTQREVVLDDELVAVVAQRAAEIISQSQQGQPSMADVMNGIEALTNGVAERLEAIETRLSSVETTREKDEQEWSDDLAKRVLNDAKIRLSYRPSEEKPTTTKSEVQRNDLGVDVESVLARIPRPFGQ